MTDLGDVRRAQDRSYGTEGIPMIVALVDEQAPPSGGGPTPESTGLAARLDAARETLAGSQRDGDLGILATVFATVAHDDFGASP